MSELRIYEENGQPVTTYSQFDDIRDHLAAIGVQFERWEASMQLDAQASQDEVIEAYRGSVNRLMNQYGFKSVDVISLQPTHPQKDALRNKFLSEHRHEEFEVRFFVEGEALFYIRENNRVHGVLCSAGDLISVPANVRHWFDMGPNPNFKAIRLFITPDGWVANYTGDKIADQFPRLEAPHYYQQAA
ncbi:MAG: AraC family ligand binding domain-containing protein [Nevskia sp.]|jgi:1,2-dihydroxy-3-keto-5-methylthiopentene dioxygenase|nr:AraC family ligand binding domain-containing protein [Nevskia sp.]MCK9384827.1 AraC family ligand binding domain-containing protein [Nevskia sp.]